MISLMRCHLSRALLVACLLGVFLPYPAFPSTDSPNFAELRDGWRMTSAKNVTAEDVAGFAAHL